MPATEKQRSGQRDRDAEDKADFKVGKHACACPAAELVARFMNYRTLTVAVALIAFRLVVSAEPKAADTVFYKGKAPGLRIPLSSTTATWRPAISRSPNLRAGKQRDFTCRVEMDRWGRGKMRFAPAKGAKKEVLLEVDPLGNPPSPLKGTYTAAGKTVPFTLTKRKKH